MKKTIRKFCKAVVRRFYPMALEAKIEYEGKPLKDLKYSGGEIHHREGCIFCGTHYMSIGSGCVFGRSCRIDAIDNYYSQSFTPELIIGNNVTMEDWCHIGCINRVEIGDGTMIASRVFIEDHYHGFINSEDLSYERPALRPLSSKPVKIGRNVWIGDGVSIMPGVELGDNVIVGANAVVTHSFPPNSVIAGCPAKVIKTL